MKENEKVLDVELIQKRETSAMNNPFVVVFVCVSLMGLLFKIMHWPFAGILITLGIVGLVFSLLIRVFTLRK